MEKLTISIRITPDTRKKLVQMRADTGLAYGTIVDLLVLQVDTDYHKTLFGVCQPTINYSDMIKSETNG